MSWELKWEGRATDFVPDLLATSGKPGALAFLAKEALWEAVQRAGERNPSAWVNIRTVGNEDPEEPGSGVFEVRFSVSGDAPENDDVQGQLLRQQPISLLKSRETSSPPEPAGSSSRTGTSHTGEEE